MRALARSTLPRDALRIALVLCEECDWTTGALRRPMSSRALANETRMGRREAQRAVALLREGNWLAVHERGALQVPVYRLTMPWRRALALVPAPGARSGT